MFKRRNGLINNVKSNINTVDKELALSGNIASYVWAP